MRQNAPASSTGAHATGFLADTPVDEAGCGKKLPVFAASVNERCDFTQNYFAADDATNCRMVSVQEVCRELNPRSFPIN